MTTIYARLMNNRLERPLEETRQLLDRFFPPPKDALMVELEQHLRDAYVAGVRDGYARAVAEQEDVKPSQFARRER